MSIFCVKTFTYLEYLKVYILCRCVIVLYVLDLCDPDYLHLGGVG